MNYNKYSIGISSIKEQLARYTHESVLNHSLEYLGMRVADDTPEAGKMPWIIMFMLKMAVLGEAGNKEISTKEFHRIANEIFHLQSAAAALEVGSLELKLRAMILSQLLYQKTTTSGMRELIVQGSILSRSDNYYDELFVRFFGLSLDSYLKIVMFIVTRLDKQQGGVVKMPISEILFYLSPGIPNTHILAFIRLASCEADAIPSFMELHDLGGIYESEYFQETPFKYIPFLLEEGCLVAFNSKFCITALCALAPAILKKEFPAFKDKFGNDMELRVGEILNGMNFDKVIVESELSTILRGQGLKGKLVDFIVREEDRVTLIECKAIEPTDLMKCTADAKLLKGLLDSSYIKAIHQGQSVADGLSKIKDFYGCNYRLLVVTFGDHYVFGGKYISEYIDTDLVSRLTGKYGSLPIQMDRISYLSLQDFAGLAYGLNAEGRPLGLFLDSACDAQSNPETRRFTLGHVVEETIGKIPGSWAAGLSGEMDKKLEALTQLIGDNSRFWKRNGSAFLVNYDSLLTALSPGYSDL